MIKIKNLSKKFGSLQVLNNLDLEINEGETLVILGRSGVGKSVLLKHILGITKPDEGSVEVNGQNVSELHGATLYSAIKDMGMLFQGAALFDSMNIEENVGFHLKQHGNLETGEPYTKEEIHQRVNEALKLVELEGTNKKTPSELSGGMKKRAGLARLIAYRPKILLYDEPTTGLDPITSMQINQLIRKTQKELSATSIVVTHDIVSAFVIGDRFALHKDAKITYVETPEKFLEIDDPLIQSLKRVLPKNPESLREI